MNDQNRIAALKSTKLAQELTDDEVAVLAAVVTLRDLKPGEVLVKEGPSDNHLYVILHGDLAVIKNAGTDAAETLFTLGGGRLRRRALVHRRHRALRVAGRRRRRAGAGTRAREARVAAARRTRRSSTG